MSATTISGRLKRRRGNSELPSPRETIMTLLPESPKAFSLVRGKDYEQKAEELADSQTEMPIETVEVPQGEVAHENI